MNFALQNIFMDEKFADKKELFHFLALKAELLGIANDPAALEQALLQRELEFSTGIQEGFAIPHAKAFCVKYPSVIYVNCRQPLKWQTFDGSDVEHIFCLLVPEKNESTEHIAILSHLATCIMETEFRTYIKQEKNSGKIAVYLKHRMEEK